LKKTRSSCSSIKESHLAESTEMAGFLTILGTKKCLHKVPGHARTHGAPPHAEDVHVVILNSLLGREMIMNQAGPYTLGFIGTDRGPHTTATNRNTPLHLTSNHCSGQRRDIIGVIIARIQLMSPEVDNFMTRSFQLGDELLLEFKSAVICCKSYTHRFTLFCRETKARGKHSS